MFRITKRDILMGIMPILFSIPLVQAEAPYCVVDFAGKRCWYQDIESCKQAAGEKGSCIVNREGMIAPIGDGNFCLVESWQTQCIYSDVASCQSQAIARRATCMRNPNHLR